MPYEKNTVVKKAKRTKNLDDINNVNFLSNRAKYMLREAKDNYHKGKLDEHKNNPKAYWKCP